MVCDLPNVVIMESDPSKTAIHYKVRLLLSYKEYDENMPELTVKILLMNAFSSIIVFVGPQ